ncbi:MAG TPA: methionine ABC transporter substrate-binding protein, partial [Firmicutes bacterium]|nr:methionine ABC transporter substrate-binding protein [Bacillota bacterium]
MVRVILALVLCVGLGACGQDTSDESVIKVGINGEKNQVWDTVERLLAEEGIKLEVITFGDYVLPNEALADGEIDANSFQTIAYFEKFIEDHELDLTSIAYTVLAPMGIYSAKIDDLSQLKDGASVG